MLNHLKPFRIFAQPSGPKHKPKRSTEFTPFLRNFSPFALLARVPISKHSSNQDIFDSFSIKTYDTLTAVKKSTQDRKQIDFPLRVTHLHREKPYPSEHTSSRFQKNQKTNLFGKNYPLKSKTKSTRYVRTDNLTKVRSCSKLPYDSIH